MNYAKYPIVHAKTENVMILINLCDYFKILSKSWGLT
jgi:hypothetical protein